MSSEGRAWVLVLVRAHYRGSLCLTFGCWGVVGGVHVVESGDDVFELEMQARGDHDRLLDGGGKSRSAKCMVQDELCFYGSVELLEGIRMSRRGLQLGSGARGRQRGLQRGPR